MDHDDNACDSLALVFTHDISYKIDWSPAKGLLYLLVTYMRSCLCRVGTVNSRLLRDQKELLYPFQKAFKGVRDDEPGIQSPSDGNGT